MANSDSSGAVLTVEDIDTVATRIASMWDTYNTERRMALTMNEEVRQYVLATDIDSTTANILPHKNRTHQPKLTQISDTLQTQYYEASLSMPDFFTYKTEDPQQDNKGRMIAKWVRTKLEQKKFRETVGRQLINDFVVYGNCFCQVDYVIEKDGPNTIYKGPVVKRVSPLDIVFNPRVQSFFEAPKLQRVLLHISDLSDLPNQYPTGGFRKGVIDKAIAARSQSFVDDWIDMIKERGINMDGFGSWADYFKQDMVEVLIYRGSVFNPDTGETQRNRVVYVVDRMFVIRNERTTSPTGMDGLHHAGWRIRPDNLWAQGPLDNLVGMQYRIDHLENLKADVFDLIAHPTLFIKGDVTEPENGFAPGSAYYGNEDTDVKPLTPDPTALNANTEIQIYHRIMEDAAGVPPETRGIRTPGEKTAFEVSKLDGNATILFVDKARNFERMLETMLKEIFELMLLNFDESDYVAIFNDITGAEELRQLSREDVLARGDFVAVGARYWTRRNRETLELSNFMGGPAQDPKIRQHINGLTLARIWEKKLGLEDDKIVEEYAGVREDARAQIIAREEASQFAEEVGPTAPEQAVNLSSIQRGPSTPTGAGGAV